MDRLGWLSYADPIAIVTMYILFLLRLHPGVNHDRLRSNNPKPRFAMAIWINFATLMALNKSAVETRQLERVDMHPLAKFFHDILSFYLAIVQVLRSTSIAVCLRRQQRFTDAMRMGKMLIRISLLPLSVQGSPELPWDAA